MTDDLSPSVLLRRALPKVQEYGSALDVGAGDLHDCRYLLSEGFREVVAIDKDRPSGNVLDELMKDGRFVFRQGYFERFDFPSGRFDLINAQCTLPLLSPNWFDHVWIGLLESLACGGVITGHLFGRHAGWEPGVSNKTFHTPAQVRALLGDLEIITFEQREWDGPKNFHVFDIIARKP